MNTTPVQKPTAERRCRSGFFAAVHFHWSVPPRAAVVLNVLCVFWCALWLAIPKFPAEGPSTSGVIQQIEGTVAFSGLTPGPVFDYVTTGDGCFRPSGHGEFVARSAFLPNFFPPTTLSGSDVPAATPLLATFSIPVETSPVSFCDLHGDPDGTPDENLPTQYRFHGHGRMNLKNGQNYIFKSPTADPFAVFQPEDSMGNPGACPPPQFDFSECPTLVILTNIGCRINGGTMLGLGPEGFQAQLNFSTFDTGDTLYILVRGDVTDYEVIVNGRTGDNPHLDWIRFSKSYTFDTVCNQVIDIEIDACGEESACPPGKIIGQLALNGFDLHGNSLVTLMTAENGPKGNFRYSFVPAMDPPGTPFLGIPAEGAFCFPNLPLENPGDSNYDVRVVRASFGSLARFQFFVPPTLRDVEVECDSETDIGNAFSMDPGFVQGKIRLCGPVDCGDQLLAFLYRDVFVDVSPADGVPDNWKDLSDSSRVAAYGATADGGLARVLFDGSYDALTGCFEGPPGNAEDYQIALAGLNQQPSDWDANELNLKFANSSAPFIAETLTITDNAFPTTTVTPGSVAINDHNYCFGEVTFNISANTDFYDPELEIAGLSGGATDADGNPADYAVSGTAMGEPQGIGSASMTGTIKMVLPAGEYTVIPKLRSSSSGTTILQPVTFTVGCRECKTITPTGPELAITVPNCVGSPAFEVDGTLTSTNPVTSLAYMINGIAPAVAVAPLGLPFNAESTAASPFVLGTNSITVTATDSAGGVGSSTLTFVYDPSAAITLNGPNPLEIECLDPYVEHGATASNCTAAVVVEIDASAVDNAMPGSYTVSYKANDASGNVVAEVFRTVIVQDTTAPVIELAGANPQMIECPGTYEELGATASDTCDMDLGPVVIDASAVDVSAQGSYVVTYNISDASGNAAAEVTRTVIVKDTMPPSITLNGEAQLTVMRGDPYVELGAVANDACDPSVSVTIGGEVVDTSTAGTYTVTYDATDSSGNAAEPVTRIVDVIPRFAAIDALFGCVEVKIENDADIIGSVASQRKIALHNDSAVSGDARNVEGKVDLHSGATVGGSVEAGGNVDLKQDASVAMDVTSRDDIDLKKDASIGGDATAEGSVDLGPGANVDGTISEYATVPPLDDIPMPILSIEADGPDVEVPKNDTLALAPGSYGKLEVGKDATLQLESGTYVFKRIDIDRKASLEMNLLAGGLHVKVEHSVHLKDRVQMSAEVPEEEGGAEDILFEVAGKHVKLGREGGYLGTWLAPEAHIDLEMDATLLGALYGDKIHVKNGAYVEAQPALALLIDASPAWAGFDVCKKSRKKCGYGYRGSHGFFKWGFFKWKWDWTRKAHGKHNFRGAHAHPHHRSGHSKDRRRSR